MTAVATTASDERPDLLSRSYALAQGVELLGPYRNGGFSDALFLVRRGDGRMLQLSRLPYLALAGFAGGADPALAATRLRRTTDRPVDDEDLRRLAEDKFVPLGLLAPLGAPADDASATQPAPPAKRIGSGSPLLGLRFKIGAVSPAAVNRVAGRLRPLYRAPVMAVVLVAAVLAEIVFVRSGGFGVVGRGLVGEPGLLLAGYAILVGSVAFHEFGHATACRYGGATPGRIGMGIYIAWPVLFADVTDSYRLGRWARVRTDLGGLYFNTVLMVAFGAIYAATRSPVAAVGLVAQNLIMFEQLIPVIRLDGYWCVSDLAGVPDLYRYVGPLLGRLLPWRRPHPLVGRLTRAARVVVSLWMALAVPFLAFNAVFILYNLVPLLRTGWGVAVEHVDLIGGAAVGHHPLIIGVLALVEFLIVVVPMFGLPALALTMARALVVKLRSWTAVAAPVRLVAGAALFGPASALVVLGAMR